MQIWLLGGVIFFLLLLGARLFMIERNLRVFFRGKKAENQEAILYKHGMKINELTESAGEMRRALEYLSRESTQAVKKVGMVRFNPFSDSGGDQSFAIALLDGNDTGFVISSLYLQGQPMVYAKPIERGNSSYALSEEEKMALAKATKQA